MSKILIIMTHTGTWLSRVVRHFTGNTYNHVSISLKEDLSEMYSFGRRYPYNAIVGGFVQEHPNRGTFRRFKNTICQILELEVSEESYRIISDIVKRFYSERKRFGFNIRGVIKARKNVDYQTSYRKFYCSQFVKYLLVCAHIVPEDFFGSVATPQDFAKIPGTIEVYQGLLRDYPLEKKQSTNIIPEQDNGNK